MTLAVPFFLIGLIVLVVPIVIHLWSKNTKTSLAFGSLRFLKETETRTMRSIQLSQWLLLLLRLLLFGLLVLFLTHPMWKQKLAKVDTVYLVDIRYAKSPLIQELLDTLSDKDEMRWLANNFPSYAETVPLTSWSHWLLLSNPPTINSDRFVVVSPLLISDFWGSKKDFPIAYEWMKLPADPRVETGISFVQQKQAYQLETSLDEWQTTQAWKPIENALPIRISYQLKTDEMYMVYGQLFEAAIATLNELGPIELIKSHEDTSDWMFWFSSEVAPKRSKLVTISPAQLQPWQVVITDKIMLSADWNRETAIQHQLPKKLLELFGQGIKLNEQLAMDSNQFEYKIDTEKQDLATTQDASSWIWLMLLVVFLSERFLAFKSDKR